MTVTEKDELVNIVTGGMGVEELDAVPVELEPALPEDELFDAYQVSYADPEQRASGPIQTSDSIVVLLFAEAMISLRIGCTELTRSCWGK